MKIGYLQFPGEFLGILTNTFSTSKTQSIDFTKTHYQKNLSVFYEVWNIRVRHSILRLEMGV